MDDDKCCSGFKFSFVDDELDLGDILIEDVVEVEGVVMLDSEGGADGVSDVKPVEAVFAMCDEIWDISAAAAGLIVKFAVDAFENVLHAELTISCCGIDAAA